MLLKSIAIVVLATAVVALSVQVVGADSIANHVVISEIQADSISGSGGTNDDWIELYNPTNEDINLSTGAYRIEKTQTATDPSIVMRIGDDTDGSYPGGTTIPAHGFYLIVCADANSTLRDKADAICNDTDFTWTGSNYTLYLGDAAITSDDDLDIIDKVGFGSATYYEGSPAPAIPEGNSLHRKVNATINYQPPYGPAWDSDDNSADFFIQESPNPTNSTMSSANPMPPIPELPPLILFATGLLTLAGYALLKKGLR